MKGKYVNNLHSFYPCDLFETSLNTLCMCKLQGRYYQLFRSVFRDILPQPRRCARKLREHSPRLSESATRHHATSGQEPYSPVPRIRSPAFGKVTASALHHHVTRSNQGRHDGVLTTRS